MADRHAALAKAIEATLADGDTVGDPTDMAHRVLDLLEDEGWGS